MNPGVRAMIGSALAFSSMSLFVRLSCERLPSQEVVFVRAAISLALSVALCKRARVALLGQRRVLLFLRGLFGFLAMAGHYYAIERLPLAEATVLYHLAPVLTALLAARFLAEPFTPQLVGGFGLALVGVGLVAQPVALWSGGGELDSLGVGVALAGACSSACALVIVRRLSSLEHPHVIVLYFPLVAMPGALLFFGHLFVMPRGIEWVWLACVGVSTQIGQVLLTRGLRALEAGKALSISYLQIVFASLWGALFLAELPGAWTLPGAALVALGAACAQRGKGVSSKTAA